MPRWDRATKWRFEAVAKGMALLKLPRDPALCYRDLDGSGQYASPVRPTSPTIVGNKTLKIL